LRKGKALLRSTIMGELARAGDSAGAAAAGENAGREAASASIAGAV